jgi:ribonuclease D
MLPAHELSDRLFLNMPTYASGATDVVTAAELSRADDELSQAPEWAVDAEMDAMHAFRPHLCFVQIATDQEVFLLDALSPELRLEKLAGLFADPVRLKYFHAAGGDLQYLAELGIRVKGLFDTHRAATLLGWPKVGLADLVRERLQVELPKEHQQADFSIRPLPRELRQYIADDVRYLCELGRQVREECRKADILEEVELDCQRLADEALSRPEIGADYKVKLPQADLSPEERALGNAIALALHQLRLRWAEAADIPFGRVLSNSAVGAIATRRPNTLRELAKTPFVRQALVREHGDEVLAAVRDLRARSGKGELPIAKQPNRPDASQRKREELLREYRTGKAAERKVTGSVVLSNALITELARMPPQSIEELARIPYFGEKRLRMYGRELLQVLGTAH